ncbi:MAG: NAD(P)-dependent oxidoreductase [Syntrophales bacterium]|nr:NAD(P)-dependent oxidoreductase [Syntrophales bacterium]
MKIAVTGASGFLGRYVLRELWARKVDTIAVVRKNQAAIQSLEIPTICLDVYHPPKEAFNMIGNPDTVIHLAWGGLPNYHSLHHFEQELPAHYIFLRSLVESGLKSLIITGTCLEYGMQSGELNENMPPQPCIPYGFSKDALRRQLEFLKKHVNFNLTWVRLFYTYGEGQSPNSLWPKLKAAVEKGEKVFPMSEGEQLRDYLPVEEVAELLVKLALKQKDFGIVNLCSGKPISVRKLVENWCKKYNWNIELAFGVLPYPDYEPMAFWGNKDKLERILASNL